MLKNVTTIAITPENAAQYGFSPEVVAAFEDRLREIRPKVRNCTDIKELEPEAQKGCPRAQYLLGREYEVNHDTVQASYWYRKAAEQGDAAAAFALYFRLKDKREEFLRTIFHAVDLEHPLDGQQPFAGYYAGQALERLARSRRVPLSDAEKEKIFACYQTAGYHTVLYALAGDREAQTLIACMRKKGYGGRKAPGEARKWYKLQDRCDRIYQ